MVDAGLVKLAADAYVYGFPIVFDLDQVRRFVTTGVGSNPAAPFNTFGHARELATPDDTFVSINNDTVYSMAQVDLSVGPVLLSVPDTAGRYYVLQFVDAWTDNFAYVGKRATGTGARDFLLLPPDWEGDGVGDATAVRFPTRIASIVGRWACDGVDDLPAVHAMQDALTLTPLRRSLMPPTGLPDLTTGLSDALEFYEKLRLYSREFPPAPRDEPLQASFAPLGLTGEASLADADHETKAVLEAGFIEGKATLENSLHSGSSPVVNGWNLTYHVFDYNLDYFEVGTIDAPEWKLADPEVRIGERAAAALAGLWGNHGYEAAYAMIYLDSDGEQLDGANEYTLRLRPTPPVGAFWSLTMYSIPDFFLVANDIRRYSIGDRTPGIVFDDDGGLTITMSNARPSDANAVANWLPAPNAPFRPILRMYAPEAAVFDGSYELPAIERSSPESSAAQ
ncbi:DUF1254 domain-containing protein [Agromyces sp. SYSU K20354]|uniref:DUF1254 domain-containing protein n=1 Tax=Agromyces cavernae TaxID=2898659 RepID=UPI001E50C3CD|nr:DUF1254 domain-containing protein [Agromyces cavernae]MCD2442897.1 DUF1254 domain-containing protein [Agromyces cavernae]